MGGGNPLRLFKGMALEDGSFKILGIENLSNYLCYMVLIFSIYFHSFSKSSDSKRLFECLELQDTLCDGKMCKGWFSFCEILNGTA